jgi:hypothetical protein
MNKNAIVIGDIIAIAILTIIGFATHDERRISYLPRMAASFLPVLFAWFVLAPWFGLFDEEAISNPKHAFADSARIPVRRTAGSNHPLCRIGNSCHSNVRAGTRKYEFTRNARLAVASWFHYKTQFKIIRFK